MLMSATVPFQDMSSLSPCMEGKGSASMDILKRIIHEGFLSSNTESCLEISLDEKGTSQPPVELG